MAATDSPDVTLALVDTSILSCWKEKVKQGHECSLLLTHSKGKVFTTFKCSMVIKSPEARENCHLAPQAEEKRKPKKNKGRKKKRLESLLAFHQRLLDYLWGTASKSTHA